MREVDEIILHCSATRPGWMQGQGIGAKVAEIRRWHVEDNGWKDIGYHFLIDVDGEVMAGRPLGQTGAHVVGKNQRTIGICLIGGHGSAASDAFEDHFSADQRETVNLLCLTLGAILSRPLLLRGHNNYAAKACPGFKVSQEFGALADALRDTPNVPSFVNAMRRFAT